MNLHVFSVGLMSAINGFIMKTLLVLVLFLCSSVSFGNDYRDVFKPSTGGFLAKNVAGCDFYQVKDPPKPFNQGVTDLCASTTTELLYQHEYCKETSEFLRKSGRSKEIIPCKDYSPEKIASVVAVRTRCMPDNVLNGKEKTMRDLNGSSFNSFVPSVASPIAGCNTNQLLFNLSFDSKIKTESCYPFEKLVNAFRPTGPIRSEADYPYIQFDDKLRKYGDDKRSKVEGRFCEECYLEDIRKTLHPEMPKPINGEFAKELVAALDNVDAGFAWGAAINLKSCNQEISLKAKYKPFLVPDCNLRKCLSVDNETAVEDEQTANFIINESLKANYLVETGVLIPNPNSRKTGHSIVLSGVRCMCPKADSAEGCEREVEVINSWGPEFCPEQSDGSRSCWFKLQPIFDAQPFGTYSVMTKEGDPLYEKLKAKVGKRYQQVVLPK